MPAVTVCSEGIPQPHHHDSSLFVLTLSNSSLTGMEFKGLEKTSRHWCFDVTFMKCFLPFQWKEPVCESHLWHSHFCHHPYVPLTQIQPFCLSPFTQTDIAPLSLSPHRLPSPSTHTLYLTHPLPPLSTSPPPSLLLLSLSSYHSHMEVSADPSFFALVAVECWCALETDDKRCVKTSVI